jgi:hypothetical protein
MANPEILSPDEIVYRRISAANHWWIKDGKVDLAAFLPNKSDRDGLSLARASEARQAAASGTIGKKYFVVALRVAEIQRRGLIVLADSATHAIIQGWTPDRRNELEGNAEYLTTICGPVEGPFDGQWDPKKNSP